MKSFRNRKSTEVIIILKQSPRKQFTIPEISEMVAISAIPCQRMLGRFEKDASFERVPQFERTWFTVSFHICNFRYYKGTSIYQLFNRLWMYFYGSSSFIIILRRSLSFCLKGEMMLQGKDVPLSTMNKLQQSRHQPDVWI